MALGEIRVQDEVSLVIPTHGTYLKHDRGMKRV
jgi:hypothetical protein